MSEDKSWFLTKLRLPPEIERLAVLDHKITGNSYQSLAREGVAKILAERADWIERQAAALGIEADTRKDEDGDD